MTQCAHPSFVPRPQAGAKQQLAVTMAIVGATLWLEGVLSRNLTSSVGKDRAGWTPLSCSTEERNILGLWWEKGIEPQQQVNRSD